jgi:tetratricopeptide (TPR) repeat protein
LNRGALSIQEKRFAEAEADLKRARETGSDAATVHFNFALLSQARRDRASALDSIDAALRLRPDYREALELRSRVLSSRP